MPAPISVIIPTLNSSRDLPKCLSALTEALTHGLIAEVIFADGGSTDLTEEIAEEVGAKFLTVPKGRGSQLAKAAELAKGEWLLFLHSDSVLENNWSDCVASHISRQKKAASFKLRFDDHSLPARTVARWANFRARVFRLPYGDQGLLISRGLYDDIGGYSQIPLMEDVEIAKKLKKQLIQLPSTIETSAEKYQRNGWLQQTVSNLLLRLRFFAGTDPHILAAKYYD